MRWWLTSLCLLTGLAARAENPITRGTPLQMTNIILNLARSVAGIDFGDGVVTQLNTGYGLVGGPITNGGTIAVNSNVVGTVVAVSAGTGLTGGTITRSGTLGLDTNLLPWVEAGTNIAVVRSGRTNTVHGTVYGLPQTNVLWVVVSNHASQVYYAEYDGDDTNGVLLSYTPSAAGFYRLEFADTFHNTNAAGTAFDGRYLAGLRWTDPSGQLNHKQLLDMTANVDTTAYNWGANGTTNFWYGNTYWFNAAAGQEIVLTNRVIISWSPGDYSGYNYFKATLSTVRTNIFLGL